MDQQPVSTGRRLCLALGLGLLLGGCGGDDAVDRPPNSGSDTGTVRFVELEGGFWGLVADSGTRYRPLNLSEEFQEDGLRVSFDYRAEQQELATAEQWGLVVELTRIEVTDV